MNSPKNPPPDAAIYVTRPFLPSLDKYLRHVEGAFARGQLTNDGPLLRELTARLEAFLGVRNLLLVANGTLALQVAFRALDLRGSAVTTPFTFAATASALDWEGIRPLFADIDPHTFNLDPQRAEAALQPDSAAIVPVHVYGNPCAAAAFDELARRRNLKIIYDAAHAFGIRQGGHSLLRHGDAQTLSFHATKVFHCAEGGGIVFRDAAVRERAQKMINFGIDTSNSTLVERGINAKLSELHAAMGLAVLDDMPRVLARRCELLALYRRRLGSAVQWQRWADDSSENGGYVPVLLADAAQRTRVVAALQAINVVPRAYFSPALQDTRPYRDCGDAAVARDIAGRILCLPVFCELGDADVERICAAVLGALR